jgi:hypothetical protein
MGSAAASATLPAPAAPSWLTRLLPDRYHRPLVWLFFGLVLALGMRLVRDYGSFGDETLCRESGQISLVYVYEFVPPAWLPARAAARLASVPLVSRLPRYRDRDYGVAFELPMTLVEKLSGYRSMHDIWLLRHQCVFLVCIGGLIAFYWLATQRFVNWRIGLLGTLLLLLSPRQYADFFYNCKDAVFLSCFLLATATGVAFIRRPRLALAAGHALACAIAIDVRLMAVLVPLLTVAFLVLRTLHGDYPLRRIVLPTLLYGVLLALVVVAMWPYLWPAPLAHFREAFANMSRFRWEGPILHQGNVLPAGAQLPWSYAAVWIGITTPLLYLGGLAISFIVLLKQLIKRNWRLYATDAEWQDLLFWALALGPLVAVVVLHSVLYDGWRQLYFVYPALLLLALRGLVAAWRWRPVWPQLRSGWQVGVGLVVAASLALVAGQMVRLHPLENLYFNALAGSHPELRYEYDYWALSFRQGLAWIAQHDARPHIRVRSNLHVAAIMNSYMLAPDEQARLVLVAPTESADYFLTNYRYHVEAYPLGTPVYSLRTAEESRRVIDVFRLP